MRHDQTEMKKNTKPRRSYFSQMIFFGVLTPIFFLMTCYDAFLISFAIARLLVVLLSIFLTFFYCFQTKNKITKEILTKTYVAVHFIQ